MTGEDSQDKIVMNAFITYIKQEDTIDHFICYIKKENIWYELDDLKKCSSNANHNYKGDPYLFFFSTKDCQSSQTILQKRDIPPKSLVNTQQSQQVNETLKQLRQNCLHLTKHRKNLKTINDDDLGSSNVKLINTLPPNTQHTETNGVMTYYSSSSKKSYTC